MRWTTFLGKETSTEEADHQHLSNCIWFAEIFKKFDATEHKQALKDRFNGQILPYRPHVDFKEEIEELEKRGFIQGGEDTGHRWISYRQQVIGEIRLFPF